MRVRMPLATKCLLVFGGAIALSLLAASLAPLIRMNSIVDDGQLDLSRLMVSVWDRLDREATSGRERWTEQIVQAEYAGIPAQRLSVSQASAIGQDDEFVARAIRVFQEDPQATEVYEQRRRLTSFEYRYARAIRSSGTPARPDGSQAGAAGASPAPGSTPELRGVILLDRRSIEASRLLLVNAVYLFIAGGAILVLSLSAFFFVADRLILRPVRALTSTAERVREGDLSIRSEIVTGDEFERLSETFNLMLGDLHSTQNQLRAINQALDTKLNELAEANTALYDSARLKGEFLANISHELRTPLNSIIGFAELLVEIARTEASASSGADQPPALQKRLRYLDNIVTASRGLLELINGLLDMARLEAGKIDLRPERVVVTDMCQGVLGLIAPLAEKKGITLRSELADDVPIIETDPKKLQQVIFNLVSNAVKFTDSPERTGKPGIVTLRAERLVGGDAREGAERIRISVIDTGSGIPPEEQPRIFEKFHQVDRGHTREHTGTGLGLAICKELVGLLQGELQLVSEVGHGSMFSVILPSAIDRELADEIQLEARFRGKVTRRRTWF
jgi:two-component system, NarL family, sensor histidine kinase BarA